MKTFSLVIPAYNEEKNLPQLLESTLSAAKEFGFTENSFSLILVENGSQDNSYNVLKDIITKNNWQNWVHIELILKNQGYGHGIMQGLKNAHSDIIGWTHADLQCDPKNAFKAYQILSTHKNARALVKGSRTGRAQQERYVTWVFEKLSYLILGLRAQELNAQPKVFHKDLLPLLDKPPHHFAFDLYLLFKAQKNHYEVLSFSVDFPPRIHGVSKWASNFAGRYKTIWGMILYMFELLKNEGRA